ncbi:amidohydrolase [Candidatus Bathyarchaeota archaeon]|nr:amidohydrolase [Candidatus Bathyarchaeota archaeon]
MSASANLVLLEGKVLTMNPDQPSADALAVKGNRIFKVGTNESVSKLIGEDTTVIRLEGRTVVPGFIDTHIHVCDFGKLLTWLNLENVASIKEMQSCLSQHIKKAVKGKWIIGRGWNQNRLSEKRLPTRFDLDPFSPDNPVVLYHQSGQVCVVNSKALELASVNQHGNAGIDKNAQTGELTGILRDEATNLVWKMIPEPSEEELLAATLMALEKIVEAGITSVHWIVLSAIELSIIEKIASTKLGLRVYLIIPENLLDKALPILGNLKNEFLKFGGVVIFSDGYLASRTATLSQPYSDNPKERGELLCPEKEMLKLAGKIQDAGLQVVIHAVGDKAVETALNVLEENSQQLKAKNLRPRLEQATVLNEELIERINKQQAIVSVQPCVVASEFSVWSAMERLGAERARWLFPLKTLIGNGVMVVAGSDCPMEPLSPLLGIQAAVTRDAFPQERVSVEDALRMYTVNAAYASFDEKIKGSIEVGKLADFTVLSKDPHATPSSEIGDIKVEYTLIEGKVVYSKTSR